LNNAASADSLRAGFFGACPYRRTGDHFAGTRAAELTC
jgi:hypothetical protein